MTEPEWNRWKPHEKQEDLEREAGIIKRVSSEWRIRIVKPTKSFHPVDAEYENRDGNLAGYAEIRYRKNMTLWTYPDVFIEVQKCQHVSQMIANTSMRFLFIVCLGGYSEGSRIVYADLTTIPTHWRRTYASRKELRNKYDISLCICVPMGAFEQIWIPPVSILSRCPREPVLI